MNEIYFFIHNCKECNTVVGPFSFDAEKFSEGHVTMPQIIFQQRIVLITFHMHGNNDFTLNEILVT